MTPELGEVGVTITSVTVNVGDTDGHEVGPEPSHAVLGHICEEGVGKAPENIHLRVVVGGGNNRLHIELMSETKTKCNCATTT